MRIGVELDVLPLIILSVLAVTGLVIVAKAWRALVVVALVAMIARNSPLSPLFESTFTYFVQFGSICLLVVLMVAQRTRAPVGPGVRSLVVFAALAMLSTAWSIDPSATSNQAVLLLLFSAFISLSASRRWCRLSILRGDLMLVYSVSVGVGLAGLALLVVAPSAVYGNYGRYQGIFENPNYVGMSSVLALACVPWLWAHTGRRGRMNLSLSGVVLLTNVVLCGSRGALVALAVGALAVLLVSARSRLIAVIGLPFLAVSAIFVAGFLASSTSLDRTGVQQSDFFSGRLTIWGDAIDIWTRSPVFGTGYSTAQLIPEMEGYTPHNLFLAVLLELGLLGLVAFGAVVVNLLRVAQKPNGTDRLLVVVPFTFIASQQFEASAFGLGGPAALTTWILLGAVLARTRRIEPDELSSCALIRSG